MEQLIPSLPAAAFLFSLWGGMHDLLTRRIPNWLTFPAMVLGLLAQAWLHGGLGALHGGLGIIVGFALFFPLFAFGYMGAGDVKLLMAVGAWLGWRNCLWVAGAAVAIGAVYALGEVVWRGRFWALAQNTYRFLRALALPGLVAEPLKIDETRKFAFGICVALAVAALIYVRHGDVGGGI